MSKNINYKKSFSIKEFYSILEPIEFNQLYKERPIDRKILNFFINIDKSIFVDLENLFGFLKIRCGQTDGFSFNLLRMVLKYKGYKENVKFSSSVLQQEFFILVDNLKMGLFSLGSKVGVILAAFEFLFVLKTGRINLKKFIKYSALFTKILSEKNFLLLKNIFPKEIKLFCNNSYLEFEYQFLKGYSKSVVINKSKLDVIFTQVEKLTCFKYLNKRTYFTVASISYFYKLISKDILNYLTGTDTFEHAFNACCIRFFDLLNLKEVKFDDKLIRSESQEAILEVNKGVKYFIKCILNKGFFVSFFENLKLILLEHIDIVKDKSVYNFFNNYINKFETIFSFANFLDNNLHTIKRKDSSLLRFNINNSKKLSFLYNRFKRLFSPKPKEVHLFNQFYSFIDIRYPFISRRILAPLVNVQQTILSLYENVLLFLGVDL